MDLGARAKGLWTDSARHPGRRILITLLVLAALALVIWLAVALVHGAGKGGAGAGGFGGGGRRGRPSTTVGVATATLSDVPVTLDGLGTVTPAATVTVSPQVSGVITEILFREGQTVRKGQALAVIDPRPLRMQLMQAQGTLTRDEAQLANARLLLERDRTLLAQDSIARQDVDTQAALVKQLEGTVTTDRAAVGTAQLNLGYSRVTAPVSGRVGLRVVDVGNFISAGSSTGIVVITEVSPIDVAFTVPQDDVPRLEAQARQGRLPAAAYDRTRTTILDQGQFSTLDNRVDATTGTVKAKARFPNTRGTLFPSQFVNVRIDLQTLKGVVVVPVTAVRTGPNGDFVWKLNPDRTVSLRNVVRGPGTATTTSIVQGLSPGERVITEGGDRLTDGASVQLPGDRGGGLMQACAADIKKLCGGKQGREAFMCLRQNQAQASASCKAAMSQRGGRGGQGAAGGGNAGGQAGG
ncbi:MAG TPA: efflux RND transporter periplasmic adaptor subunit, partial [Phenylobacterium sp.]|nr:efflux RND transporter periplasmic adaptor subunit [Phenylobacterium sp.]